MANTPVTTCQIKVRKPKRKLLDLEEFPVGTRSDLFKPLYEDATGTALKIPLIVVRGERPGPTLGITAAVHGNELNGVRIIQELLADLNISDLRGILVCVPVVNIPAFNMGQRYFSDGLDLNHVFPGKADGKPASQYARAFSAMLLPQIDYLVDIHTASEGRTNTMYVRVDLHSPEAREMALKVNPQIILHSKGGDGTLRNAATRRQVPAITVEAGNPSVIQGRMVFDGGIGIRNVMVHLNMLAGEVHLSRDPVICESSKWLRTTGGGMLEPTFRLMDRVDKRQLLAITRDLFGNTLQEFHAPNDGIVIGMAANPVAIPGTRFCHLGKVREPT